MSATDFAILVLNADDMTLSRGSQHSSPRDNVVFELGLFMGALGRNRTLIVLPDDADIKIPTDLLGITPIAYHKGEVADISSWIAPACTQIAKNIERLGSK